MLGKVRFRHPLAAMPNRCWNAIARQTCVAMPQSIGVIFGYIIHHPEQYHPVDVPWLQALGVRILEVEDCPHHQELRRVTASVT